MLIAYNYIIGIDPGVNTGFAVWGVHNQAFMEITTVQIHTAMQIILPYIAHKPALVRVEDARLRKWYGNDNGDRTKSQGAGSIKRDCSIWEDFLKDMGVYYEMVAPKDTMTKLTPETFRNMTGLNIRTSKHARDAAMLCWKYK